ncbi:MAG TPA: GNAT family N-acetyltransferase [Myxococcaceae bacterium]|nr:GNAT family N-acetyltransferase [Myxococcaceae bacterium]
MNPNVTVRRATVQDAARLSELGARTFADAYRGALPQEHIDDYVARRYRPERQSQELSSPEALYLLAEVDGAPAGFALLLAERPGGEAAGRNPVRLDKLYLEQRWTGRGVGDALMRACLDEGRRRGHDVIWLTVWQKNLRAQKFYERWGFRHHGLHPFEFGGEVLMDFALLREL